MSPVLHIGEAFVQDWLCFAKPDRIRRRGNVRLPIGFVSQNRKRTRIAGSPPPTEVAPALLCVLCVLCVSAFSPGSQDPCEIFPASPHLFIGHRTMNPLLRALTLFTLALSVFAAEAPKAAPKPAPKATAKPQLSDSAIEQDIRARFARSKIAPDKFQVKVQGGVATIEGKTDIIQHKGSATRMARTGGAIQVVNKIQISENARQRASANLEKGRKKAEVKRL